MEKRWCNACGEAFEPRAQSPRQLYCSKDACQQSRKRLWQKTKRKTDHDYHQNQAQAQANWRGSHPDYWRRYRQDHPDYTEMNRTRQKQRNANRGHVIAKSDASADNLPLAGVFKLTAIDPASWAGQREWIVQLVVLP